MKAEMRIVVTCAKCGHEYEATRQQVLAGTWRRCPVCQPREDDDEPAAA